MHFKAFAFLFLAWLASAALPPAQVVQPFAVGERAEYEVRYGVIRAGSGALSVVSIDTVRGRHAYRFRLTLDAGINLLLYKYSIRDTMESWVDTATFASLRFTQNQVHRGKPRMKHYEIFPERQVFADGDHPEQASVSEPLDDISLLYFARRQPLEVGTTTEIPRHFKPASNPVVLKVIRKETIEAAGRTWNTVVIRPIIKTSTVFADGDAQVWMSDDSARVIVQISMKAPVVGSITLKLRSYQPTTPPTPSP